MTDNSEDFDVFISYSRADLASVEKIRRKLEALRLTVFFDTESIESGQEFPELIDRAVKNARSVLGLWTREAIKRRWVRIEGRVGLDQNKLVAAAVETMQPHDLPVEFYNVNLVDLSAYDGTDTHDGWMRVVRAIGKKVGREGIDAFSRAVGQRDYEALKRFARAYPNDPLVDDAWGLAARFEREMAAPHESPGQRFDLPRHKPALRGNPRIGQRLRTRVAGIGLAGLLAGGGYVAWQFNQPTEPPRSELSTNNHPGSASPVASADPEVEREYWNACKPSISSLTCEAYLKRYPTGVYAVLAQARLAELAVKPTPGEVPVITQVAPVPPELTGSWEGLYGYADSAQRVRFEVDLAASGRTFRGRMREPNTFGDSTTKYLYSDIVGEISERGVVNFTKKYDGTGGPEHSVRYSGQFQNNRIIGDYTLSGTTGPFEMVRR